MMNNKQLLRTMLAGAVALLAACGDSTGSSTPGPGSASFSFTGARAGSYSASGAFRSRGNSFVKQPFAVGVVGQSTEGAALAVISYSPVSTTTGNMVLLGMPNTTGGTFNLDPDTCTNPNTVCPFVSVIFDTNPDLEEDDSQLFVFTSGTITVTSNTGNRATGTFSGTAESFSGDSVITVANGTFDVPVRTQAELLGNRAVARSTRMFTRETQPH